MSRRMSSTPTTKSSSNTVQVSTPNSSSDFVDSAKAMAAKRKALAPKAASGPEFIHEDIEEVDTSSLSREQLEEQLRKAMEVYKRETEQRKKLHNDVQEMKGNIRVFCRARPLLPFEIERGDRSIIADVKEETLTLFNPLTLQTKKQSYDAVFGPDTIQSNIFNCVEPIVTSVLDGFNACIFAYGQTGSGKTHTMVGSPAERGVNHRALDLLFGLSSARAGTIEDSFSLSMMEIYNEKVRDLFIRQADQENLEIKQSSKGMEVAGLTEHEINSMNDVWRLEDLGNKNRSTFATNMNEHSSRSHAILMVRIISRNLVTGVTTWGKLTLVDLAGSERVSKSEAEGDRLKEAQYINKSLSALTDVITALNERKGHVPFRNSKLTFLLQDSLGGNSKTLMFVCINPSEDNIGETISSLSFATRVRSVELGAATKQVDTSDLLKYKKMYDELLDEVEVHKRDILDLKNELEQSRNLAENLERDIGHKDGELEFLKLEILDKENQIDSYKVSEAAASAKQSELLSELEAKDVELDQILDSYTVANEAHKQKEMDLREEIERLTVAHRHLTSERQNLSETDKKFAELEADVSVITTRLKAKEEENISLNSTIKSLHEKIKEIEGDSKSKREVISALEKDNRSKDDRIQSLSLDLANRPVTGMEQQPSHHQPTTPSAGASTSSPKFSGDKDAEKMLQMWDGFGKAQGFFDMSNINIPEDERNRSYKMLALLEKYTDRSEYQMEMMRQLIAILNSTEGLTEEEQEAIKEQIMELERIVYVAEEEKMESKAECMAHARHLYKMFKVLEEEKVQLQRQFKYQFSRAKAAFDVVKEKLMKNIGDRAAALKTVKEELSIKEDKLTRLQQQKSEAERGLVEMRSVFEDMKRIEQMKRGSNLIKYAFSGGGKPSVRWTVLTSDELELRWGDSKSKKLTSSVRVDEIEDVVIGFQTTVFKRMTASEKPDEWLSFSIILSDRTIDFTVGGDEELLIWVRGLHALLSTIPGKKVPTLKDVEERLRLIRFGK